VTCSRRAIQGGRESFSAPTSASSDRKTPTSEPQSFREPGAASPSVLIQRDLLDFRWFSSEGVALKVERDGRVSRHDVGVRSLRSCACLWSLGVPHKRQERERHFLSAEGSEGRWCPDSTGSKSQVGLLAITPSWTKSQAVAVSASGRRAVKPAAEPSAGGTRFTVVYELDGQEHSLECQSLLIATGSSREGHR
jgi:hypothetical protein